MNAFREFLHGVTFADPEYFPLLPILGALAILAAAAFAIRWRFAPERTYASRRGGLPKAALWAFALVVAGLMILALARPYAKKQAYSIRRGSVDVIVLWDGTISMLAPDVHPNRFATAKNEILDLGSDILKPGDRAALFVFGRSSLRKLYLSGDLDRFEDSAARVGFTKDLSADEFVWNTDLPVALEHAYESMDDENAYFLKNRMQPVYIANRDRIVFLFTDGDDDGGNAEELGKDLAEFQKRQFVIYPIGIGTRRGVPLLSTLRGYPRSQYPEGIEKEWAGVQTRLNPMLLDHLAAATGGKSFYIDRSGKSARSFMQEVVTSHRSIAFERTEDPGKNRDFWWDILIAGAAVLLMAIIFT